MIMYILVFFGTPSLAIPTLTSLGKASTASVSISYPRKFLTDELLGLALDILMSKPKPFLLLKVHPPPSVYPFLSPEMLHTCSHKAWVPPRRGFLGFVFPDYTTEHLSESIHLEAPFTLFLFNTLALIFALAHKFSASQH